MRLAHASIIELRTLRALTMQNVRMRQVVTGQTLAKHMLSKALRSHV
jgi:hypothetical protein